MSEEKAPDRVWISNASLPNALPDARWVYAWLSPVPHSGFHEWTRADLLADAQQEIQHWKQSYDDLHSRFASTHAAGLEVKLAEAEKRIAALEPDALRFRQQAEIIRESMDDAERRAKENR